MLLAAFCVWSLAILPVAQNTIFAQSARGAAKPRVAVLDFKGLGLSEVETAAITDQMRNDLVNLKAFTVLDRSQTDKVLGELAFQQEGLTEADQAAKIGQILNVEYIVTGRVTKLGEAYQVNAQMIDVETVEIVRSESIIYRGDIIGLLSENIASIAARLSQVEPPPSRQQPVQQQAQVEEEGGGMPTWAWIAIGVGVLALAAGGGGGEEDGGGGGGGGCSGCGSIGFSW